jgi:hypothetical protein
MSSFARLSAKPVTPSGALSLGDKVRRVSVRPEGGGWRPYVNPGPVSLEILEGKERVSAWIITCYCGAAAELKLTGQASVSGAGRDFQMARTLGGRDLGWRDDEFTQQLAIRRRRAADLVVRNWAEIEIVAQALVKKKALTGRQIEALFGANATDAAARR